MVGPPASWGPGVPTPGCLSGSTQPRAGEATRQAEQPPEAAAIHAAAPRVWEEGEEDDRAAISLQERQLHHVVAAVGSPAWHLGVNCGRGSCLPCSLCLCVLDVAPVSFSASMALELVLVGCCFLCSLDPVVSLGPRDEDSP